MPKLRGEGSGDLIAEVDVRLPKPVPDELRRWASPDAALPEENSQT